MDEGYIKFNFDLEKKQIINQFSISELNECRTKLKNLNLIGYKDGISFGNVSKRINMNSFIISGSDTGKFDVLNKNQFCLVDSWNLKNNYVHSIGLTPPSSESLTHAAIYEALPDNQYVIHIHSKILWNRYLGKYLSSKKEYNYGTPDIALNIKDLVIKNSAENILIMGGHFEGLIFWGNDINLIYKDIKSLL